MQMTNKTYDKVKWIVSVVLPACGVLVGTLGKAYAWDFTDLAVTTISAITVFLGSVFMVSSKNYQKNAGE
ncbi:MAG: phage holin [Fervidobacterium sp.]|jgi:hypothetical protein|nr:phage holin [Fervidobacterium sp.]